MSTFFRGRVAVDFDGTLAHYDEWKGPGHVGEPIKAMAERMEAWLRDGTPVVIFTSRLWSDGSPERDAQAVTALVAIQQFCARHFGKVLPVTCIKDPSMYEFWDDRAVRVEKNTGRRIDAT